MMKYNDCIFLNSHGDLKVSWTDETHNNMKNLIEKKMEDGMVFFVIEKKIFGLIKKETKLTTKNKDKLLKNKTIIIQDEDVKTFYENNKDIIINQEKTKEDSYNVKKVLTKEDLKTPPKENETYIATQTPVGG